MMLASAPDVSGLLHTILSSGHSERHVSQLVNIAYKFSAPRLKYLLSSGKLHLQSFNISLEGLAFDCIAELFRRDKDGTFTELTDYFCAECDLASLSPEETLHHFRSLVYNKVYDGIFRLYREHDPIVAKIIRNVKISLEKIPHCKMERRLGLSIAWSCQEKERNDHLPELPFDELESALQQSASKQTDTLSLVKILMELISAQTQYRRFYSVIDMAVIIKHYYAGKRSALAEIFLPDPSMIDFDMMVVVGRSFENVRTMFHKKYVAAGKIDDSLFSRYIAALEQIMTDTFLHNDGSERSHPDYLAEQIPGLTQSEYREIHRTHFEYMVRTAKEHIKKEMKELFG